MVAEFALTFVVTALATPVARIALIRFGVLDVPNDRSSHTVPVPRGGGLACTLGVLAGLTLALATGTTTPTLAAIAGVAAFAVLGFEDDRRGLSAPARLLLQVAGGVTIGASIGGPAWAVLGLACLPVTVNVVNFMDGINGITGLTVGVWGVVALAAGTEYDAAALAMVGAVTAGAAFGFLPWNAVRARVFLGDSGSYLFGALVGVGVLLGLQGQVPAVILLAPLSIYLVDTTWTLVKRALRHEALLAAHREHVYQRLVADAGFSHLGAAALATGLASVVTGAWWFCSTVAGIAVTTIALTAYIASPRVLANMGGGDVHGTG